MLYLGMNQQNGHGLTDVDHIRQSVRDILVTPIGTRLERREYGSMLSRLIDKPQNAAGRLQVIAATYTALCRWEPRITLDKVSLSGSFDGQMNVDLAGHLTDGRSVAFSVSTGVHDAGN